MGEDTGRDSSGSATKTRLRFGSRFTSLFWGSAAFKAMTVLPENLRGFTGVE